MQIVLTVCNPFAVFIAENPSCMTLPLIFFILNGMVMANQSTAFPKLKFLCVFKRRCTGACNCPNINPIKSIRLEDYQMSTIRKRIPMFLFALAMMVAMALPTFAAEPRALLDVSYKD